MKLRLALAMAALTLSGTTMAAEVTTEVTLEPVPLQAFSDFTTPHDQMAYCTGVVSSVALRIMNDGLLSNNTEMYMAGVQGLDVAFEMSEEVERLDADADHGVPADAGKLFVETHLDVEEIDDVQDTMNGCKVLVEQVINNKRDVALDEA